MPVNRNTIAAMIKSFAEGTLIETLAHVIRHVQAEADAKVATLQARIAELEGRGFCEYKGVYAEGTTYRRGCLITDHGNMWLALTDTKQRPPSDRLED